MINIAIDGHSGSGKSSVAMLLAQKLGFKVLDTGAIYRGMACEFDSQGLKVEEQVVEQFAENLKIEVFFKEGVQHVSVNGTDWTSHLRGVKISALSSQISPFPILRDKVTIIQRKFAKENNCILEGRDIGNVVLPNADVKLFITASVEERARRRLLQLSDNKESYEEILENLKLRDYRDEHREVAPLKVASDAIVIDTTNLNLEETVEKCYQIIKDKLGK